MRHPAAHSIDTLNYALNRFLPVKSAGGGAAQACVQGRVSAHLRNRFRKGGHYFGFAGAIRLALDVPAYAQTPNCGGAPNVSRVIPTHIVEQQFGERIERIANSLTEKMLVAPSASSVVEIKHRQTKHPPRGIEGLQFAAPQYVGRHKLREQCPVQRLV